MTTGALHTIRAMRNCAGVAANLLATASAFARMPVG